MNPRVLIVDDEQAVLAMCVAILDRAGYETVTAQSGQDALGIAESRPFDLLLTDLRMPGMGGIELVQAVFELQPEIATMIMTGYGTMDSAIEALRLGVSEYLLKPFGPDDLRSMVGRALERHQLRAENARLQALLPLFDLNRTLLRSSDLETALRQVVEIVHEQMRADRTSLMLVDDTGQLVVRASQGLPAFDGVQGSQQAQSVVEYVLAHQEALVLSGNLSDDGRFGSSTSGEVRSAISLPLTYRERPVGVLNVSRISSPDPFVEADRELLVVLAGQAAIAIENARLFSEIQSAYARLSELDHLKDEFISVVSHELRAPLGSLLAFAELLDGGRGVVRQEYLDQVVQSAYRLREIINQITTFKELSRPDASVHIDRFEVGALLNECWADFGRGGVAKGLAHQILVPVEGLYVEADRSRCKSIIGQLVSNACEFTPDGGEIALGVEEGAECVRLFVSDTGPGIAAEQQEMIFEPFYQAESALTREHGGLGLGLALARETATSLGATLTVESTHGQGATFWLELPL